MEWTYDGLGRLKTTKNRNLTINSTVRGEVTQAFTYNNQGLIKDSTLTVPGLTSQKMAMTYRDSGSLYTTKYSQGGGATLETVTVGYNQLETPNWIGVRNGTNPNTPAASWIGYDAHNRVEYLNRGVSTSPGALNTRFRHAPETGLLDYIRHYSPDDMANQKLATTWDPNGNLLSIRENEAITSQYQCFEYDIHNRLDLARTSTQACDQPIVWGGESPYYVDYGYNNIGNITGAWGANTPNGPYSYGAGDAGPNAVTSAGPTGPGQTPSTYAYDKGGNMISRTRGVTTDFFYGVQGKLILTKEGGNDKSSYLYDASGNRVKRTIGNESTYYHGSLEITQSGGSNSRKLVLSAAGQAIGMWQNGQLTTLATDHLGSVGVTRTNSGTIDRQRYLPSGGPRNAARTNMLALDQTFTGQTDDPGTGLIHYEARMYDPYLGRFTQADTIIPDPTNQADLNRFSYVRNNPLAYTDPSGNDPCLVGPMAHSFSCGIYGAGNSGSSEGNRRSFPGFEESGKPLEPTAGPTQPVLDTGKDLLRTGLFDERSCRSNGGAGGLEVDTGCIAEVLTSISPCKALIKALCRAVGNSARRLIPVRKVPTRVPACLRSFSRDTEVLLGDGVTSKPISEFEPGDEVWALNPETGESGPRRVEAVWPHHDWLLSLEVEGGSVTTTEDHRFWNLSDNEWQETQHLDPGDFLITPLGDRVEAGSLDWTTLHFDEAYDLTIQGIHSYFVDTGNDDVLVHNCGDLQSAIERGARIFDTGGAHLPEAVVRNLKNNHGVSERLASARIHAIKKGIEGNPDLAISLSGDVWDPRSGDYLGSLTQGGGG